MKLKEEAKRVFDKTIECGADDDPELAEIVANMMVGFAQSHAKDVLRWAGDNGWKRSSSSEDKWINYKGEIKTTDELYLMFEEENK